MEQTTVAFTVPGVPVAQPRQRHRAMVVNGKTITQNYTPKGDPVQTYKATVALAARESGLPPGLWDGPISLHVTFYLPRPNRLMRKKDDSGCLPHTAKPDTDNLVKAVKDALTGVLWRDDSLIWSETGQKLYHEKDGKPRTEVVAHVTGLDQQKGA